MNREPFELLPWQKRQAALLYHYASLDYLKGLKQRIDELIAFIDPVIAARAPLDTLGRAKHNWGPTDTVAHFNSYTYPALMEFRESVISDIAARAFESYDITGANQYGRMFQEYGYAMTWATPEQEEAFKARSAEVVSYASKIDTVMRRPPTFNDGWFSIVWNDGKSQFPRLPRFRVRTDVEGETDKIPPRTGVYVPQDDPYGALQFRWTGGGYGKLCECVTFNDIGLHALREVGRARLWEDDEAMFRFTQRPEYKGIFTDISGKEVSRPRNARFAVSRRAFTERPCKWYFVELVNGEYEDHDGSYAGVSEFESQPVQRRVPAGMPCPRSGWWHTPAAVGSRRRFREGEVFPQVEGSAWGATFWQWAPEQN